MVIELDESGESDNNDAVLCAKASMKNNSGMGFNEQPNNECKHWTDEMLVELLKGM